MSGVSISHDYGDKMTYSSKWLLVSCLAICNALLLFAAGLAVVHSMSMKGPGWPLKNYSMLETSNQILCATCYVQFSLLGALAVWGPDRARDRWFVVGAILYLHLLAVPQVFAQGINPAYTLDDVSYWTLHSLIVFALTCLLLAPVGRTLGWHFYCEGTETASATGRSFSLLRLLTWTTMLAVILAIVKATYGSRIVMHVRPGFEAIGSTLPILIPTCLLVMGRPRWRGGLALVVAWTLLVTGMELLLLFGWYNLLGAPSAMEFTRHRAPMMLVFNGFAVAILVVNVLLLRAIGLRLRQRPRSVRTDNPMTVR
jgi:hypothetical protein